MGDGASSVLESLSEAGWTLEKRSECGTCFHRQSFHFDTSSRGKSSQIKCLFMIPERNRGHTPRHGFQPARAGDITLCARGKRSLTKVVAVNGLLILLRPTGVPSGGAVSCCPYLRAVERNTNGYALNIPTVLCTELLLSYTTHGACGFIDLEARASAAVAYRRRNRHIVRSARRILRRGTRTDTKIQTYRTVLCTEFCASVVHDSWGLRQLSISKHAPPQPSPTAAASANRHIVRSARRIFRRAPLGQLPLQRVHSQGDERGDGDTRRHGLARRRASRRRERTTQCSGCPNA